MFKQIIRYPRIVKLRFKTKSSISRRAVLNKKTVLNGRNKIGYANIKNSQIGFGSYILSGNASNISVGKYVSIGHNFNILVATHPINYISTYPGFYQTCNKDILLINSKIRIKEFLQCENGKSVNIGNDVWIGDNVTILGGISIGDGAVVGANALVTKDVPPYAIVGGVPAKIIRFRFDAYQIECLKKIKWWDWTLEKIQTEAIFFDNVNKFIKRNG